MKKSLGVISALTLGLGLALAAPTAANAEPAGTIVVPFDFDPTLSDTRATGHYELVGSDLHLRHRGQHIDGQGRRVRADLHASCRGR